MTFLGIFIAALMLATLILVIAAFKSKDVPREGKIGAALFLAIVLIAGGVFLVHLFG